VSHREMDFLIGNAEPGYDLLMGWSLRRGFEAVLTALQGDRKNIDLSRTKFNFSRFIVNDQLEEARHNNVYCGHPLRIDPDLYVFFHGLYRNRNLIKKDPQGRKKGKRMDLQNFSRLLQAFGRYIRTRQAESGARVFVYGYLILITYLHSLGLEGQNYRFLKALVNSLGRIDRRPPRAYIEKGFAEENARKLTGNKIGMYFTNMVGPLWDIDTPYEYEFVKANFGRLRESIDGYYAASGMVRLP
jgi:hypothetical protein